MFWAKNYIFVTFLQNRFLIKAMSHPKFTPADLREILREKFNINSSSNFVEYRTVGKNFKKHYIWKKNVIFSWTDAKISFNEMTWGEIKLRHFLELFQRFLAWFVPHEDTHSVQDLELLIWRKHWFLTWKEPQHAKNFNGKSIIALINVFGLLGQVLNGTFSDFRPCVHKNFIFFKCSVFGRYFLLCSLIEYIWVKK